MTTLSLSAVAAACAASLVTAKSHEDKAAACKESANKAIVQLNGAGAVVGDKRVCSIAFSFHDGLVTGGWAKRTADNYLSTFRKAVASGKPVTDWNPNRKDAKAKASAKGKAKGKKEFADKLATVYRDGEFEGFINDLQASFYDDEIKTLMEGVKSYLEASGIEIK